ncbi:protein of unknown function DUF6593 [Abortiporus biennis]
MLPITTSSSKPKPTILTLNIENLITCTFSSEDGTVQYSLTTIREEEDAGGTIISQIKNVRTGNKIIGQLKWRSLLPDCVLNEDGKWVSIWDWLKKSKIPLKSDVFFTDNIGRKYKWKKHSPGYSLVLFAADDNYTTQIAQFNPLQKRIDPNNPMISKSSIWTTSILSLKPRALEIQDLVVTSCLFLDKNYKDKINIGKDDIVARVNDIFLIGNLPTDEWSVQARLAGNQLSGRNQ